VWRRLFLEHDEPLTCACSVVHFAAQLEPLAFAGALKSVRRRALESVAKERHLVASKARAMKMRLFACLLSQTSKDDESALCAKLARIEELRREMDSLTD